MSLKGRILQEQASQLESKQYFELVLTNMANFQTIANNKFFIELDKQIKLKALDQIENESIQIQIHQIKEEEGIVDNNKIYCKVLELNELSIPDEINIWSKRLKFAIITLSDRAFRGEYEDLSGPEIKNLLQDYYNESDYEIDFLCHLIPDKEELLRQLIKDLEDQGVDAIFTTGGTGLGPKDITIEVIKPLLDKDIPGIMELIRVKYGTLNPNALVSRSIAGLINNTLIYTLPGSIKAVREYISEIAPTIKHSMFMIHQIDKH